LKPIRYTPEMIDEYTRDGYWTDETFYDFYDRNAREFGDREALVDSKYRLTWSQAKRLVDGIAQNLGPDGHPPRTPGSSSSRPTASTASWPGSPAKGPG